MFLKIWECIGDVKGGVGQHMKEILMMVLEDCPYCKQADAMIRELQEENEKYREITVQRVDEEVDIELSAALNYYYVPCFFVDGEKLMEGVPTKEKVKAVLDAALANGGK